MEQIILQKNDNDQENAKGNRAAVSTPIANEKIRLSTVSQEQNCVISQPSQVQQVHHNRRASEVRRSPERKKEDEEDDEDREGFDHLPPEYSPKKVNIILYYLFFANLFFNIDMGILPAGSLQIKQALKMNNSEFGFLGSVVYFGQTVGSALAAGILNFYSPKQVILFCLFLNISFLLVFTLTTKFWILAVARAMTGVFQIFFTIYQPCWADVFGNETQKSKWLAYLIITTPLGVVLGYCKTAIFLQYDISWKFAFYV